VSNILERLTVDACLYVPDRRDLGVSYEKLEPVLQDARAEIERLRDFVDGQACECHDEYGTKRPRQCDRCRLLGKEEARDV